MLVADGRGDRPPPPAAARRGVRRASGQDVRRPLRAQVRGAHRRVPGVLRPLDGVGQRRADRRRGRHHRRAVDRRARHAADHAYVPHRRRRRRGHHARPAAHRRAVRGAQAEGPGEDRRGRRRRDRRGHRQVAHRRHHRRRRRGAPPHVPAPHAPVRRATATRSSRARSSTRARCTRTSCWRSAAGRRPRCTSSRRCRRSTSPRAWTSTTSTSRSSSARCSRRSASTRRATRTTCPGQFVDRHEFRAVNDEIEASRRRAGAVRGDHPRHHQGVAGDGLVPVGGLLPGDHQGADRRRARGQDRPPGRPEGERHHREADPGGDGPQALPHDRDRAGRAAAPRHRRRRPARGRRPRRRARA